MPRPRAYPRSALNLGAGLSVSLPGALARRGPQWLATCHRDRRDIARETPWPLRPPAWGTLATEHKAPFSRMWLLPTPAT